MDKNAAIKLSKEYLDKVRKSDIPFSQVWLFGSYARDTQHKNSDIDLAIVMPHDAKTFDTEVKLMTLRSGEETMIEPHPFDADEFQSSNPMAYQILQNGLRIDL